MNNAKSEEITGFICNTCKKEIAIGACGQHREETEHKDFDEIFQDNAQKMKGGDK